MVLSSTVRHSEPVWRPGLRFDGRMNPASARSTASPYVRHPREIAAAVTLPVAAAALVASGSAMPQQAGRAAVATACAALVTRMALIRFIAAAAGAEPTEIEPFDPFHDATPTALHGIGAAPDRQRLRVAGARCVDVWHWWRQHGSLPDDRVGVAGAVALGAWCSWALGSLAQAEVRAQYAIDTVATDALAGLVQRSCRAGRQPTWWG